MTQGPASGSHEEDQAFWGQKHHLFGIKEPHGVLSSIYRKQEAYAQDQAHASVGTFGITIVESFRSCQIVSRQPNLQAVGRAV